MKRIILIAALLIATRASAGEFRATGPTHEAEAITCHLPEREHLKNAAGRDGLGLCVFTSIDMAARWANEPALIGLRDFMTRHPGGGYPEKVEQFLPRMAASKNMPVPGYAQHTGGDPEFLRRALATGRYVCVTYDGRDGVFYRNRIAHMVNLVHLSDQYAVIQDNNFPGKWLWMTPADFLSRWTGTGGGWAIVLLRHGPPPIPVNIQERPIPQPMPKARVYEEDDANFGVEIGRMPGAPIYRVNGQQVTRDAALAAVGSVPDDRDRLRLTIVGEAEWRRQIVDDWEKSPAFAGLRDRVLVQSYPPDHWAVLDIGLATGITLQLPARTDGTAPVLFRTREYAGPERLAGAIRQADPKYKPERDPDPSRPVIAPAAPEPPRPVIPAEVWYGLGGLLLAWIAQRLKLPWPPTRKPDDVRPMVREALVELLRPPPDDSIRQRLAELARTGPPSRA